MSSLVVVGAQWGDEGKGKLVDYLTSNSDLVVRFQGGNNAGHTLLVDGVKTKLRLVPSGILRSNLLCCIAAGVVLDADVFVEELGELERAGVSVSRDRLVLDESLHLKGMNEDFTRFNLKGFSRSSSLIRSLTINFHSTDRGRHLINLPNKTQSCSLYLL